MEQYLSKVREFQKIFKDYIEQETHNAFIPDEIKNFRNKLLNEEVKELQEAMDNKNIIKIADGIGDILYVLLGTAIVYGLDKNLEEIFYEIHRSNMTKLWLDGKAHYREDGKILKGINFEEPKLKEILEKIRKHRTFDESGFPIN